MGDRWRRMLEAGAAVVLDGGTGSELRRRGVPLRHDVWSGAASLTHFDDLCAVHAEFIAAGADVVVANTFATSRFVLDAADLGDRFQTINRRAVEAAQTARATASTEIAIAGSISCLPPSFDVRRYPSAATELASYRELAALLRDCGVDLLILEMLQDTQHAARACAAAAASGLPFWLGVSCRTRADGALVTYDFPEIRLDTVLDALLEHEPAVVCVMHSPADAVAAALEAVKRRYRGIVGAYPEWPADDADLEAFVRYAEHWRRQGAAVLGGCCGTTPAHIRALRAALR